MFTLESGSKYKGEQLTNNGSFKIEMKIDFVDLNQEYICGTFDIFNITDNHDLLTTYFEGKIMGKTQYLSDSCLSLNQTDIAHWSLFPEWRAEHTKSQKLYDIENSDYIYIKIKEMFMLPDPNVKYIPGASIDGYYYCCYYKQLDFIAGHYFYNNSSNLVSQQMMLERKVERLSKSKTSC